MKQRMLWALLGANCLHEPVLWPQSESEANLAAAWPLAHVHETHHPPSVSAHINVCSLHSPNEQGSRPTEPALPSDPATQA